MGHILRSITAVFFGISFLVLGNGLLSTLITLRGVQEGFSEQLLGLLTSAYFLGALIGTQSASRLIRRMGHIRCFTFTAALLACCTLIYVLLLFPVVWLVVRLITGFSVFVMYTVIESWLNGQTPDEYRSRVFSIYTLVNLTSIAAAQQLLHLAPVDAFTLFAIAAVLVTASVMPVSWTRLQQPNIAIDMPSLSILKLYRTAPVAVVGVIVSGLVMGPFYGLMPLFAASIGYSDSQFAMLMSLSLLGGAVIQYPVGRLSDRHDRRRVMLGVLIVAALIAMAMSGLALLSPGLIVPMIALSMLFCGLVLSVYPICVAHLVDRIHKDHLVAGSSGLLLLYGLGAFIGPAGAGVMLQVLGGAALPVVYLVTLAVFSAATTWLLVRSTVVEHPEDHEAQYVAMVRTTANVLPLHPDSEEEIAPPDDRREESRAEADAETQRQ